MNTVIGDLTLIKSIGKGNYGEVYLSQLKGRHEYFATKKMDKAFFRTPENWKRLAGEIEILQMMNHPNILKFCGLKKSQNHYYLITDYCNGGTLSSNLRKYMSAYHRPFPEEIVQYLMKQIVNAIYYLHFNKIIHRDLKLDNILVNFPTDHDKKSLNMMSCSIKIIDFGFATKLNGPLTYTALGTPTNMDPKILQHIKTGIPNTGYNETVDIWSLGTLCYEMVVGHMAFSGASMEELYQKVKNGTYSLPLTLSKELVSFINGMLQQDPQKRLTAAQLLNHEFLKKHPSQFHPIDTRKIPGTLGPGGIIKMKTKTQPEATNGILLWDIFNQPGIYQGIPNQMNIQVQPQMQLPSQQPQYIAPQQGYYVEQKPFIQPVSYGEYY